MMLRVLTPLFLLAFALPAAAPSYAKASEGRQDETVDYWVETLKNSLDLDDDQESKARKIIEEYMEKNNKELDKYRDKMKEILKPEQKEAFEDLNDSYAQGQGGGNQNRSWGNNNWTRPLTSQLPTGKELKAAVGINDKQAEIGFGHLLLFLHIY